MTNADEKKAVNASPDGTAILKTLRPGHPRLLVLERDLERVKRLIETDPTARRLRDLIRKSGEDLLDEPTVKYEIVGPRLLTQSRRALDRVYTLATLYRLDGDKKWVERAKKELFAAVAFPDWNPSHFLDTAEMTHAFAIGYDWLYDALSPDDRKTIRAAIVEKGLKRGREAYEGTAPWRGWTKAHHNWNQVCNGGMILGALAVAEEEPELASFIVTSALKSLPLAMASFGPDGGWNEGPGYWSYTVRYTVPLIAALESALGSDFGLPDFPGFDRTGMFRLHFVGPTGKTFNYADASEGAGQAPDMHWVARRFKQPLYHWEANRAAKGGVSDPVWFSGGGKQSQSALDLLWYGPAPTGPKATGAPLDALFKGVDVAFFRSAWEDPDALYVGFKGGDNAANHSHLDLGTFVFDALGERWAVELGGDNYNLPAYFGKERWNYYRLRTEGQNTLLLNGQNQATKAKAPLIAFRSEPEAAYAVADLSTGYAGQAEKVWRGIALVDGRKSLLVQDEFTASEPVEYAGQMHTRAAIEVQGLEATMKLSGKILQATILEPEGAVFKAESAAPPAPQNQNEGVRKLVVRLPEKVKSARVAVLFTPMKAGGKKESEVMVTPLAEWVTRATESSK
ncbi:MAG: heparinase II/III family protein [Armatimonadetes bacterium]|nr:heparinase II/III family protein [Armatimonadota bacterium]